MDLPTLHIVNNPHAIASKNVVNQLHSDEKFGLNKQQIKERIAQFGKNEIPIKKPKTKWRILAEQFFNSIIYILTVAALLAFIFRDWAEGIAILIVILALLVPLLFLADRAYQILVHLQ